MPTPLNYNEFVAELAVLSEYDPADPNFVANLPSAINYAEDRINRELNLLSTVASNSLPATALTRQLDISSLNLNVLSQVNVVTPSTQTDPELGTRNQCTPTTKSFLDAVYNSAATAARPVNFAMLTDQIILFGPFPDANYTIEITGTLWVPPLSASNATTWISTYLPDLMLTAAMIQMTGFMRNFGAQSDNPQMAVSFESQYNLLRDSAAVEDARRRFASAGWTSQIPSPATPPRT